MSSAHRCIARGQRRDALDAPLVALPSVGCGGVGLEAHEPDLDALHGLGACRALVSERLHRRGQRPGVWRGVSRRPDRVHHLQLVRRGAGAAAHPALHGPRRWAAPRTMGASGPPTGGGLAGTHLPALPLTAHIRQPSEAQPVAAMAKARQPLLGPIPHLSLAYGCRYMPVAFHKSCATSPRVAVAQMSHGTQPSPR